MKRKSLVINIWNFAAMLLLFCVELSGYLISSPSMLSVTKGAFYLLAFVCMSISAIMYKSTPCMRSNNIFYLLFLYLLMLGIRLYYDFNIHHRTSINIAHTSTVWVLYFSSIFIPFIFFSIKPIRINYKLYSWLLAIILGICLFSSNYENMTTGVAAMNYRFQGNEFTDLILYGHLGTSLVILGTWLLIHKSNRWICYALIIDGTLAMMLAGTRSTFVALFACFIFYLYAKGRLRLQYVIIIGILIVVLWWVVLPFVNNWLMSQDVYSLNRVLTASEEYEHDYSNGRTDKYSTALNFMLDHPLFGRSYLFDSGGFVHNLFVEQYMALGLFGGTLFLGINIIVLKYARRIIASGAEFGIVPLLYIQYMIYGCFSRTAIILPLYWLFLFWSINIYNVSFNGKGTHLYHNSNL